MSADNFYVIRKHPKGGYAAVMGFASDARMPKARAQDPQFSSIVAALRWASDEYSEYGVTLHPECDGEDV